MAARSGFGADCIQPGLTQLQPPMDNYMDITFEPFQGLFLPRFFNNLLIVLIPVRIHVEDTVSSAAIVGRTTRSTIRFIRTTAAGTVCNVSTAATVYKF